MPDDIIESSTNALLYKIRNLVYLDTIFSLEEDFNRIGLTVQLSSGNRAILCKIVEGRAAASSVMDDYMFLGSFAGTEAKQEVPPKLIATLSDFVMNKAGASAKVTSAPRRWQHGIKTYGQIIRILDEDVQVIAQNING